MPKPTVNLPNTGAVPRKVVATDHVAFAAVPMPYDWSKRSGITEPPDEEQNGSLSCTAQAAGYKLFADTGLQLVRRDPYSKTFLPGGGAYLVSPIDDLDQFGILLRDEVFNDPSPEDEKTMETRLLVKDGYRERRFSVKRTIIPVTTIDAAAQALDDYKGLILGIAGSWNNGWEGSWTDPYFGGDIAWRHALFAFDHVMRNGKKALVCKSSWCSHTDFKGKLSKVHYINEDYFKYGVFEIVAVEIKEINTMAAYTILINGKAGLIEVTPDGFIVGKLARNEVEFQDLGKQAKKETCSPDPKNKGKWIFAPIDFQKK